MNKVNFIFIALISAAMFVVSCGDDEEDPTLSILPQTTAIVFSADGQTATSDGSAITPTFTVSTNQQAWDAKSNKSWVRVVAKTSTGFSLSADANATTTAPEEATITVTAGEATPVSIKVTQSASAANLSVSPSAAVEFSADGTKAKSNGVEITPTFTVTTNVDSWDAVSSQSWLHVIKQAQTFSLTADAHTSITPPPAATVTVTAGDATPVVIAVTQASAAADLSLSPADRTVELPFAGGEKQFTVTTNATEWNAIPSEDWVQIEKDGNTLKLKAEENLSMAASPEATVTVSAGAAEDIVITVTQPGNPAGAPPHALSTSQTEIADAGQIWSDYINYDGNNKAAAGTLGSTMPNVRTGDYVKVEQYTPYYYNWYYIIANESELCPAPWRIPTSEDLINQNIGFGGTGVQQDGVPELVKKYEDFGLVFSGRYMVTGTPIGPQYPEAYAYLWSSSESLADTESAPGKAWHLLVTHPNPNQSPPFTLSNVAPHNNSSSATKSTGKPIRCVRNK